MEEKQALNHMRRWMRLGLLEIENEIYIRRTKSSESRRLFADIAVALEGTAVVLPNHGEGLAIKFPPEMTERLVEIEKSIVRTGRGKSLLPLEEKRIRLNLRLQGKTIERTKKLAARRGLKPKEWARILDEIVEKEWNQEGI